MLPPTELQIARRCQNLGLLEPERTATHPSGGHSKRKTLEQCLEDRERQLQRLEDPNRRRLDDGPPQRYELTETTERITRGSIQFFQLALCLRAYGLSRDELLFALEDLRRALEALR